MEIVFNNVSYNKYLKNINITFKEGLIYGLTGKYVSYIKDIMLDNIVSYKGEVKKGNYDICLINSNNNSFLCNNVKNEIKLNCKIKNYNIRNIKQEVIEIFYKLDINEELYYRNINELSRSEKYLIKIVTNLVTNPNVIIFENIFDNLDLKYRNKLKYLLEILVKDKIIIILDNNADTIYGLVNYIYIINDSKTIFSGDINKVYQQEELAKYKDLIPSLCAIVHDAKKKGIKLPFRKDVRDTMKDIYRNV